MTDLNVKKDCKSVIMSHGDLSSSPAGQDMFHINC